MLEFKESKDIDSVEMSVGGSRSGGGEICAGCSCPIRDRWVLKVGESPWHEDCLICSVCRCPLSHSCYIRGGKLYCKTDYDRIFGVKCSRCGEKLLPREFVQKAASHVFHLACFVCAGCCSPLQKGDQFMLRGTQILCRADFEKELFLLQQGSPRGSDDLIGDENSRPRDGRRGPKRPRTILTSAQRRQFKASFEISPKPCRKVREALAKETGLSVRVVQVWFQNQRAKMKKIQRKAKADDKGDGKEKDGEARRDKSDSSSGQYEGDDPFRSPSGSQPLNPNMPYSPEDGYPAHGSPDSFCSSELSLDESPSCGGGPHEDDSGPDIHNLDNSTSSSLVHRHTSTPAELLPPYTSINPIDKLYLMQNSYFTDP